MGAEEIIVDTQLMEPPEPLMAMMQALSTLKKGQYIKMIHRKVPYPFLQQLSMEAYFYQVVEKTPVEIFICLQQDDVSRQIINSMNKFD